MQNFLAIWIKAVFNVIVPFSLPSHSLNEMQEIAQSAEVSRCSPLKLQCSDSKSVEEMACTPSHSWDQGELLRSNSECRNTVISCGT